MARSKFAVAAEQWLAKHAPSQFISTSEFWLGLADERPDVTTPTEHSKTPRWSCMRALRSDGAFEVRRGQIRLRERN